MAHSRRTWMKTAAMGMGGLLASERNLAAQPVNHACALADPRDEIKITKLEIIPVNSLRSIFVKMHTEAGITGIGEGTVEGRIPTVVAAIQEIEPYLIGKDARRPAHHWQAIYKHAFYRGDIILTSALGAVDIAMWDIKGKALGVPIYDLLGGPTRDRIQCYGQAESVEETQTHVLAEGYRSMKTSVPSTRGRLSRSSENPYWHRWLCRKGKGDPRACWSRLRPGHRDARPEHEPPAAIGDFRGVFFRPAVPRGPIPVPEPAIDVGDGERKRPSPSPRASLHGDQVAVS